MVQPPAGPLAGDARAGQPSWLTDADRSDAGLADADLVDTGLADADLTDLMAADREAELADQVDAERSGEWPDTSSGPPPGAESWFGELSAAERDAMFQGCGDPEQPAAGFDSRLEALGPGPGLAGLTQDVFDGGLGRLSDGELVDLLGAARRLSSWQAAVEFYAVAELDARRRRDAVRPGWSRISEQTGCELAAALTLTGRAADALLGLSRELARIPMVLAALFAGRIDRARAQVFAGELSCLNDVAAAAIAAAFCGPAMSMTTGQLRAALRAMALAVDPAAARKRAERGRADARVEAWQEGSGNGALAGRELPPAEAIAADRRIAAIARVLKEAGATGSMDQLRAAVFTALLTGRDPESLLSRGVGDPAQPSKPAQPIKPAWTREPGLTGSVNLTMPLSAWLGQSEAPGEVAGLGPVDAATCRDLGGLLAAGAGTRWYVTLTDRSFRAVAHARASPPSGSLAAWRASLRFDWLEHGNCAHPREARSYRPPDRLRQLVKVRHRTCAFPGCRRPATACDDDHTIPFEHGGRTCECNLAPLCRRHHQTKQAPGWHLAQPGPGVLVWTTPAGRTYTTHPGTYPT